jgi:5'-3' exoribonuclease 2
VLKAQLQSQKSLSSAKPENPEQGSPSALGKRKASSIEEGNGSAPDTASAATPSAPTEEGPVDDVRLWEDGYADRYYEKKFHKDPKDIEFRHGVARAYVEGLAWVLLYYFQGCPSWEWYYPYHYAPFAADFKDIAKMEISFEKGRVSKPFEQLMSVLPAASRHALPEVFHDLMLNPESEIIDFYPEDFEIDLNGKKMAWQGVALLPFIEMPRLLAAVQAKYPELSAADSARNEMGRDVLIFSEGHESLYDEVLTNFYSKKQGDSKFKLNPKKSDGLSGKVEKKEGYVPHSELKYPLERNSMPDLDYDRSVSVYYDFPQVSQTHKSMLLRGVQLPKPALTQSDIQDMRSRANRGGRNGGFGRGHDRGGYNGPGMTRGSQYNRHQGGYGRSNGHYPPLPGSHIPPPPGAPGFGIGVPPPPPPTNYHNQPYDNRHGGSSGYNQYRGPSYPANGAPGYHGYGDASYERGRGSGGYSSRGHYRDGRSYR